MATPAASSRILVLFAHPALHKSRVHRGLLAAIDGLPGITIHDLYEAYPDLHIDVAAEQKLLTDHDLIVFQHPVYWYSSPAILKEWQDLVLEHGWAYGRTGTALHGKRLLSVVSTGGGQSAYQPDGFNRYTLREFFAPFDQTARLCGMQYLPPFAVHGTHDVSAQEIALHAADYRRLLEAVRDNLFDFEAAARQSRLNADLDAVIGSRGGAP
jgi:glutathione-regulated potassium-efflux system ancillary protein KefG